ncbi:MAG: ATP-binding cassette domain-containing protein [Planctomycetota bacterium]|nr:MAG: ATP-binding cassette domain-containing protein [Planctomycetota bacterium]
MSPCRSLRASTYLPASGTSHIPRNGAGHCRGPRALEQRMITAQDISISFGEIPLYENVSIRLNAGNVYGFIGANGCGKSTFIKALAGDIEPNSGTVALDPGARMGVLRQNQFGFEDERVLDVVLQGHSEVWDIQQQMDAFYAKEEFSDADGEALAKLQERFDELDGYTQESNAAEVLTNLGVSPEYHDGQMNALDSALKVRVLLAQAIFSRPDVLLLDEPTNNLDIETIAWLEKFLDDYEGCIAVVSHDRHFLNRVCTHICDVDFRTIRTFVGNWDVYAASEQLARAQRSKERARVEKQVERLKSFVERFKSNAARSRQATSRQKQIDQMSGQRVIPSSRVAPRILFKQARTSGQDIVSVEDLSFAWENEPPLFQGLNLRVDRGDRLAIVGRNGIGKTTLMRLLIQELAPNEGTITWGSTVHKGYFPQDNDHLFQGEHSILEWISQFTDNQDINHMRAMLGRMLFGGDEVKKQVNVLSGGERVRCMLSKLMLEEANVMLLDEPTNHLDLESIEALQEALGEYTGTLIFVSHDRAFVDAVATRVLVIDGEGVADWKGTYSDYRASRGLD